MPSISVGAALAIGAGVSAAGGIASSALQAGAADKASSRAVSAQQDALATSRADLAPWTGTGGTANTATSDILGLNGPDAATAARDRFETSPGYQFSLDQGLRAIDAGAASTGMLRSGATVKAEQAFGTGLADQEFTNYYNRLFDLSKLGESAAAGSAAASTSTGSGIASTDLSQGSALASIYGNTSKGISDAVNNGLSGYLYASRTNALSPTLNPTGTDSTVINPIGGQSYVTSSNPNENWRI